MFSFCMIWSFIAGTPVYDHLLVFQYCESASCLVQNDQLISLIQGNGFASQTRALKLRLKG